MKKQNKEDRMKEALESMEFAQKAAEIQVRIKELPFYAIFERRKLEAELARNELAQIEHTKKQMTGMLTDLGEIFSSIGEDEPPTEEEILKRKQTIEKLDGKQARIALLAVLEDKSLEEALEIGQTYKEG